MYCGGVQGAMLSERILWRCDRRYCGGLIPVVRGLSDSDMRCKVGVSGIREAFYRDTWNKVYQTAHHTAIILKPGACSDYTG